jgi:dTDP-4-dehydrorhamnose reductase
MLSDRYKIAVLGSEGQLAREFRNSVNYSKLHFKFIPKSELDITDRDSISRSLDNKGFNIIINCSAYSAVDLAETHKELAYAVNVEGVANIADYAKKKDVALIHFSSDYVYEGLDNFPHKEDSPTNPINYYGLTKLLGEREILKLSPKGIILRTSWLYSSFGNNFVKTVLKASKERRELHIVSDQVGSPTYAKDLADVILGLITSEDFDQLTQSCDVYNYSNHGSVSWYEFAKEIFRISGIEKCEIIPISSEAFNQKAERPKFSILDCNKIRTIYPVDVFEWQDSLKKCLSNINIKEL